MARTHRIWATAGGLCLATAAQAVEINPYAPAPPPGSPARLERDAMLGVPGADAAILDWLRAHPRASRADRAALNNRLCEIFGVRTWHALRARVCAAANALHPDTDGDDDASMAAALVNELPIRVTGSARLALQDNALGSRSAAVTVNGVTLPWFMDTGAEITTVPQSTADRIGVRYVGGNISVGTTTAPVIGRIGMIAVLRIGDAIVENVPVFVLPDARLTIDGLPGIARFTIPGILGLPAFAAFRRMAYLEGGTTLALGEAAPRPTGNVAPIYWHDSGLGVSLATDRAVRGVHFDSGANSTYFFAEGRALLSEAQRRTAVSTTVRTGGAGGTVEQQLQELPRLDVRFGGVPIVLHGVTLAEGTGRAARVGFDAVRNFRTLVFDFEQTVMSGEPIAGGAAAR